MSDIEDEILEFTKPEPTFTTVVTVPVNVDSSVANTKSSIDFEEMDFFSEVLPQPVISTNTIKDLPVGGYAACVILEETEGGTTEDGSTSVSNGKPIEFDEASSAVTVCEVDKAIFGASIKQPSSTVGLHFLPPSGQENVVHTVEEVGEAESQFFEAVLNICESVTEPQPATDSKNDTQTMEASKDDQSTTEQTVVEHSDGYVDIEKQFFEPLLPVLTEIEPLAVECSLTDFVTEPSAAGGLVTPAPVSNLSEGLATKSTTAPETHLDKDEGVSTVDPIPAAFESTEVVNVPIVSEPIPDKEECPVFPTSGQEQNNILLSDSSAIVFDQIQSAAISVQESVSVSRATVSTVPDAGAKEFTGISVDEVTHQKSDDNIVPYEAEFDVIDELIEIDSCSDVEDLDSSVVLQDTTDEDINTVAAESDKSSDTIDDLEVVFCNFGQESADEQKKKSPTDTKKATHPIQVVEKPIISGPHVKAERPFRCEICGKNFREIALQLHLQSAEHLWKVELNEFLNTKDFFVILDVESKLQSRLKESKEKVFVGQEYVYDIRLDADKNPTWLVICSVCTQVIKPANLVSHLSATQHCVKYLHICHPEVLPVIRRHRQSNEFQTSLELECRKIVEKQSPSPIMKVIQLNSDGKKKLDDLFLQNAMLQRNDDVILWLKKPSHVSSVVDLNALRSCADTPVETTDIQIPVVLQQHSTDVEDFLWCEDCGLVILVDRRQWSVSDAWQQHITRAYHMKKKEARKSLRFSAACFLVVEASVQSVVLTDPLPSGRPYVGLESMIERIKRDEHGEVIRDVVCTLCAETFPISQFAKHMGNKVHMYQFTHKNFPEMVKKLFFQPSPGDASAAGRDVVVANFLKEKTLELGNVRVYEDDYKPPPPPAEPPSTSKPSATNYNAINKANKETTKDTTKTVTTTSEASKTDSPSVVTSSGSDSINSKSTAAPVADKKQIQGAPKRTAASSSSKQTGSSKPQDKSSLVASLMGSTSNSFAFGDRAYVQPLFDRCTEPLIGVEYIYEFDCHDRVYEPGYLCKLCDIYVLAKSCLNHVVTTDHRLKFIMKHHPTYYRNMKGCLISSATKDQVTLQTARSLAPSASKVIQHKLTMKCDNKILYVKRPNTIVSVRNQLASNISNKLFNVLDRPSTSLVQPFQRAPAAPSLHFASSPWLPPGPSLMGTYPPPAPYMFNMPPPQPQTYGIPPPTIPGMVPPPAAAVGWNNTQTAAFGGNLPFTSQPPPSTSAVKPASTHPSAVGTSGVGVNAAALTTDDLMKKLDTILKGTTVINESVSTSGGNKTKAEERFEEPMKNSGSGGSRSYGLSSSSSKQPSAVSDKRKIDDVKQHTDSRSKHQRRSRSRERERDWGHGRSRRSRSRSRDRRHRDRDTDSKYYNRRDSRSPHRTREKVTADAFESNTGANTSAYGCAELWPRSDTTVKERECVNILNEFRSLLEKSGVNRGDTGGGSYLATTSSSFPAQSGGTGTSNIAAAGTGSDVGTQKLLQMLQEQQKKQEEISAIIAGLGLGGNRPRTGSAATEQILQLLLEQQRKQQEQTDVIVNLMKQKAAAAKPQQAAPPVGLQPHTMAMAGMNFNVSPPTRQEPLSNTACGFADTFSSGAALGRQQQQPSAWSSSVQHQITHGGGSSNANIQSAIRAQIETIKSSHQQQPTMISADPGQKAKELFEKRRAQLLEKFSSSSTSQPGFSLTQQLTPSMQQQPQRVQTVSEQPVDTNSAVAAFMAKFGLSSQFTR